MSPITPPGRQLVKAQYCASRWVLTPNHSSVRLTTPKRASVAVTCHAVAVEIDQTTHSPQLDLADLLTLRAKSLRLSDNACAQQLQVSQTTFSRWKGRTLAPKASKVPALAAWLGIDEETVADACQRMRSEARLSERLATVEGQIAELQDVAASLTAALEALAPALDALERTMNPRPAKPARSRAARQTA